ncbi:hypothetical protein JCM10207_008489 [Rhodosporidiobolus poonsookiae]
MDSLGIGRKTPGSGRKISHSEYIRAIAAADTPLAERVNNAALSHSRSEPALGTAFKVDVDEHKAPSTAGQTPAKRRRSRVDRTPAQVKAVLVERKRRSSAGLMKPVQELTPGGLLRALSRMPDLPPATPSEAGFDPTSATVAASRSSRRESYIPRRSSVLASGSDHPSSDSALPTPHKAPSRLSSSVALDSSAEVAHALLASQRLSRSSSQRASVHSPAPSDAEVDVSRSRRSSIASVASVASVEAARRASVVPEDLSRFLVRRRRLTEAQRVKGEDSMMLDAVGEEGESTRYSLGANGRFSMGSEIGRDLSFAHSAASSPGHASLSVSRLSLCSTAYGNISGARLSLPASLAGDGPDDEKREQGDEEQADERFSQAGEEGAFQEDDFGGGFDDDGHVEHLPNEDEDEDEGMADRIPWADKGKGRASNEYEGEFGAGDEDVGVWMTAGEEAESGFDDPVRLPTPPPLTRTEENRKKRVLASAHPARKKNKKQRYTRTGEPVPDLPKSRQKALFQHFLGPSVTMDESAVEALLNASQEFFASFMHDAAHVAARAGRNASINESDLVESMHSHRLLSSKLPLSSLARRLGVDRDLQLVIDSLPPFDPLFAVGGGAAGDKKRGRAGKARSAAADEEDEEEAEDSADEMPPPPLRRPAKKAVKPSPAPAKKAKKAPAPSAKKVVAAPTKDADTGKKRRRGSGAADKENKRVRRTSATRKKAGKKDEAVEAPLDESEAEEDVFSD